MVRGPGADIGSTSSAGPIRHGPGRQPPFEAATAPMHPGAAFFAATGAA
ncbi:MAG: hypothetical protein IT514_06825 [Burkholderiales bacterium]|nr:hypothetical protein [Burkholderiales bacterium]